MLRDALLALIAIAVLVIVSLVIESFGWLNDAPEGTDPDCWRRFRDAWQKRRGQ